MPTPAEPGLPPVALEAGVLLHGRYRLREKLGSGGMADVFLAQDERLGRQVAVKVLRRRFDDGDEQLVRRFQIEARAAAMLAHPAIVAVFDQGQAGDHWYLVMEYVPGETLKQRIRHQGPLSVPDAVALMRTVLAALETAHEHHVVHRDVTAQNILLDRAGGVKVADFGIARIGAADLTRTGTMIGTCHYLSPEQAQGQAADSRSDLYGAGVVLFEALTGRLPFEGDSEVAVALKHVQEAPPPPSSLVSGIPPALDAVVLTALAKAPGQRFQTAAAFDAALSGALRGKMPAGTAAAEAAAPGATQVAGVPAPSMVAPTTSAPPPLETQATRVVAAGPPTGETRLAPPAAATMVAPPAGAPGSHGVSPAAADVAGRPAAARARPRRSGRKLLVIVLAVVLVAAAVGAALYAYAAGGVSVPQVVGQTEARAKGAVREAGLRPVTHRAYIDGVDEGVVARQRPGRGELDKGDKVDIWVSRGPLHIPSPDLRGLTPDEARQALAAAGLSGNDRKARSASVDEGLVARQQPKAGATVSRGDTVMYWVSVGAPLVEVPDVVGLSSGDAAGALEDAGLTVNVDLVAGLGEYPGDVIGQDPEAGVTLESGSEVTIKVAVF